MAKILYAWELGGDYGHIGSFMPLAQELRKRGHEVVFVLRDLVNAETAVAWHGFFVLQAPVWMAEIRGLPEPPANYSEIIVRFGFINRNALSGLVRAWLGLFSMLKPDLLIADHSPVSLLSARAQGIPRVLFGTGFCSPPHLQPMPNMRPWANVSLKRLDDADSHVMAVANSLLADMRPPVQPLQAVADLFRVEEDFLCTFPEMDHYPQRLGARYWGAMFNAHQGDVVGWPNGAGKKVFAYVKPGYRDFDKVLQALAGCGQSVLLFASGISRNDLEKFSNDRMRILPNPINLAHIARQSDLAVCHAGHGTIAAMLLAGVPLLLLPTQLEQYLAAWRVEQYGAARLVDPEAPVKANYAALIAELLTNPEYRARAQAFAAAHAGFDQQEQLRSMVERIEALLAPSTPQVDSDSGR